ncbi:MAG: hypothetical protein F4Y82_01450 [Cenarchaeum sp. SB0665_bin_23]|nr:hypothetical protein [Cenarchaeum sp. SB0665_bin_23]MXZ93321.1 hypothetical protein [Cenarchaeum sp. SB0666_bin_15]MYB46838.1 hypothetical protein [Cenarchaeum sp. SB0662_bin_33]MYD59229.1 hypothetical protein [Cenarchaeum sp. SB0678_bin_8]MYG32973.1 hypothetical protein [Cenarchaeum sp. SB0677_bin_16]MYJ27895.1 hypothetical protein [Cenarchaeum sp. SB0672_bin_9]
MSTKDTPKFSKSDRALMVVSDATIYGSTRLQKYGFLLTQQYKKEMEGIAKATPELKFYDDWAPLWFGPFSKSLAKDIDACMQNGLIYKEPVKLSQNSFRYGLTLKGRRKWRAMLHKSTKDITAIHKKVMNLQKMRLERLLEYIYYAYPEYTVNSTIREKISGL